MSRLNDASDAPATAAAASRTALFSGLSPDGVREALRYFDARVAVCPRGSFLHGMSETLTRFGVLLSGSLEVCTTDADGNRTIMAQVSPGDSFGESLCYLTTEAPPVCIVATADSRVLTLSPARLRHPVNASPADALMICRFTALLAGRTLRMNERIQLLSKRTLRRRLTAYFTALARAAGSRTFTLPFDRSGLADYLGADRAALSREMSAMRRDGLIELHGKFVTLIFSVLPSDK